jgi:hypothetical protein
MAVLGVGGCANSVTDVKELMPVVAGAGTSGASFWLATTVSYCNSASINIVSFDRRDEKKMLSYSWQSGITYDLDPSRAASFLVLQPGKYFVASVHCSLLQRYPKEYINFKLVADENLNKEIPKGIPVLDVRAGELTDFGVMEIVQVGGTNRQLWNQATGFVKWIPSPPERLKALQETYPALQGKIVARPFGLNGINEPSAVTARN